MLDQDVSQIYMEVDGRLPFRPVSVKIGKFDVCKNADNGVQCPLRKDQEYLYTNTFFVRKSFPTVIAFRFSVI